MQNYKIEPDTCIHVFFFLWFVTKRVIVEDAGVSDVGGGGEGANDVW